MDKNNDNVLIVRYVLLNCNDGNSYRDALGENGNMDVVMDKWEDVNRGGKKW